MLAAHLERHLRSWQGPDPLKPLGLATSTSDAGAAAFKSPPYMPSARAFAALALATQTQPRPRAKGALPPSQP